MGDDLGAHHHGDFFPLAVIYVKRFEETRLFKDFGKEYEEYRKKVPMIAPRPKRPDGRSRAATKNL